MGAAKKIKAVIKARGLTIKQFAILYNADANVKNDDIRVAMVRNIFFKDKMLYSTVEEMADFLGCEIRFVDKETGEMF